MRKMAKSGLGCPGWGDRGARASNGAAPIAPVIACRAKMLAGPEEELCAEATPAAVRFADGRQGRPLLSGFRVRPPVQA
jgi:hypothetical protein